MDTQPGRKNSEMFNFIKRINEAESYTHAGFIGWKRFKNHFKMSINFFWIHLFYIEFTTNKIDIYMKKIKKIFERKKNMPTLKNIGNIEELEIYFNNLQKETENQEKIKIIKL